jgi:hypothetical protein
MSISPAPVGPPPPYEEHDFTWHPNSDVAAFLQEANANPSPQVPTSEEPGMFSEEDLIEERFFQERVGGEDA